MQKRSEGRADVKKVLSLYLLPIYLNQVTSGTEAGFTGPLIFLFFERRMGLLCVVFAQGPSFQLPLCNLPAGHLSYAAITSPLPGARTSPPPRQRFCLHFRRCELQRPQHLEKMHFPSTSSHFLSASCCVLCCRDGRSLKYFMGQWHSSLF